MQVWAGPLHNKWSCLWSPIVMGRPLYYAAVVSVFFFLLPFFLAYYQQSEIGCLLHFHAWCGLSANLECVYEMCCTWLAGKIQESKIMQKLPSARHCTTLFGYIFTTKAHVDIQKKNLLNSNIFSRCSHNMVNFGPLMTEIGWRVWDTQQISTSLSSWLCQCTDVTQRRSTKVCTMFGRLLLWYTVYTFLGALAP